MATAGSTIRGIRSDADLADAKFVAFFKIVQSAAASDGKVFFLWAGEGREIVTDTLEGEDLSGWLIENGDADEFESLWLQGSDAIGDGFDDCMAFARWSVNESGLVSVAFDFPLRGIGTVEIGL